MPLQIENYKNKPKNLKNMTDVEMKSENVLEGEYCPMCQKKTLALIEQEYEVPFFGKLFMFAMKCANPECFYKKSDVEAAERKEPCKYTIEIDSEEDMSIRIIKSSEATIKVPHVTTIEPGIASEGYVTNIEGVLNRIKTQIESVRDNADEDSDRKKAKNLLKKLQKVMWGREKIKMTIEDPSGNSAIISEKAEKKRL